MNQIWWLRDRFVQGDAVSLLQMVDCIGMTLLLALDISSVETQEMTAISHTDFLMCRPSAQCTDVISGSPDVHIKLATMSAWKHLSVWLIYQTEVKYLAREHLVSCLHKASISYLIQTEEDILLHSNNVTYHRQSSRLVPCAVSLSKGHGFDPMCASCCAFEQTKWLIMLVLVKWMIIKFKWYIFCNLQLVSSDLFRLLKKISDWQQ